MHRLTIRGMDFYFQKKENFDHLRLYLETLQSSFDGLLRERNEFESQLWLRNHQVALLMNQLHDTNEYTADTIKAFADRYRNGDIVCMREPCAIQDCERVRRVRGKVKRSRLQ